MEEKGGNVRTYCTIEGTAEERCKKVPRGCLFHSSGDSMGFHLTINFVSDVSCKIP